MLVDDHPDLPPHAFDTPEALRGQVAQEGVQAQQSATSLQHEGKGVMLGARSRHRGRDGVSSRPFRVRDRNRDDDDGGYPTSTNRSLEHIFIRHLHAMLERVYRMGIDIYRAFIFFLIFSRTDLFEFELQHHLIDPVEVDLW